jgi:hypothetical protein
VPYDSGKYGLIRRICASLNNQTSDNSSASIASAFNQPIASNTSNLMSHETKQTGKGRGQTAGNGAKMQLRRGQKT